MKKEEHICPVRATILDEPATNPVIESETYFHEALARIYYSALLSFGFGLNPLDQLRKCFPEYKWHWSGYGNDIVRQFNAKNRYIWFCREYGIITATKIPPLFQQCFYVLEEANKNWLDTICPNYLIKMREVHGLPVFLDRDECANWIFGNIRSKLTVS